MSWDLPASVVAAQPATAPALVTFFGRSLTNSLPVGPAVIAPEAPVYPPPAAPPGGALAYFARPLSGRIERSAFPAFEGREFVNVGFEGGSPGTLNVDWGFNADLIWFKPTSNPTRVVVAYGPPATEAPAADLSDEKEALEGAIAPQGSEGPHPYYVDEARPASGSRGAVLLIVALVAAALLLYFLRRRRRR